MNKPVKISFILGVLMLTVIAARSQSLVLIHNGKELGKGAVIRCDSVNPILGLMKVDIRVKNPGETVIAVKVQKVVHTALAGSDNSFCWGKTCYASSVNESTVPDTIKSLDSVVFTAEYVPDSNADGTSVIEYIFSDVNDRANSVSVIIQFVEGTGTGIHGLSAEEYLRILPSGEPVKFSISYRLKEKSRLLLHTPAGHLTGVVLLQPGEESEELLVPAGRGIMVYSLERAGRIIRSGKIPVW